MELRQVEILCKKLMNEHRLIGWRFGWMNAKRTAGMCYYGPRTIKLSKPFMELYSEHEVRMVILHEISHAKCGHKASHGPDWRAHNLSIGGDGLQHTHPDAPLPGSRYVGRCDAMHEYERNTIRRYHENEYVCPKCMRADAIAAENGEPRINAIITWFRRDTGIRVGASREEYATAANTVNPNPTGLNVPVFTPVRK